MPCLPLAACAYFFLHHCAALPACCCLQIFFLLKESELTPTGANLLDGRFAVFGYVTEDQDAVGYMQVGAVTIVGVGACTCWYTSTYF